MPDYTERIEDENDNLRDSYARSIEEIDRLRQELAASNADRDRLAQKLVERFDIARLDAQPGDVIVIRLGEALPVGDLIRLRDHLKFVFPDRKVLILWPGMEIAVLHETDGETK